MRKNRMDFELETATWRLDEINIDTSKRHSIRSNSIGYFMRDNHVVVIMIKGKQIEDCFILVAECFGRA